MLFLSTTITIPGSATGIIQLAYKEGKVLWDQALFLPLADKGKAM